MVKSYQNKKALLIGNGVNRLDSSQSFSWHAILEAVNAKYRFKVDLDNDFKPFPLAFDEMLHQTSRPNNFSEKIKILKQKI